MNRIEFIVFFLFFSDGALPELWRRNPVSHCTSTFYVTYWKPQQRVHQQNYSGKMRPYSITKLRYIYIYLKVQLENITRKPQIFEKVVESFVEIAKLESSAERWSIFKTNWRTNSYIFAHAATTICIFSVFEYRPRSCSNLFHAPSTRQSFSSRRRGRRRDT